TVDLAPMGVEDALDPALELNQSAPQPVVELIGHHLRSQPLELATLVPGDAGLGQRGLQRREQGRVAEGLPQPQLRLLAARLGLRPRATTSTITVVTAPDLSAPRGRTAGTGQAASLLDPDGRPWGSPLVFRSDVPVPADLVFVLVVGSDARPRNDPRRSHGD